MIRASVGPGWTGRAPGLVPGGIAGRALRLLGHVHALARAYGWREADILAMSPARRQVYLDLAGA